MSELGMLQERVILDTLHWIKDGYRFGTYRNRLKKSVQNLNRFHNIKPSRIFDEQLQSRSSDMVGGAVHNRTVSLADVQ